MRMKNIAPMIAVGGLALGASAHETVFDFPLSGDQQVPPNGSPAVGAAELIYDEDDQTFSLDMMIFGITLDDLFNVGPNSTPVHIHNAPTGQNGAIVIDLGFLATFQEDGLGIRLQIDNVLFGGQQGNLFTDPNTNEDALFAGELYVNIHTNDFNSGELRGQIVPTPASVLTLAALGLFASRRRR